MTSARSVRCAVMVAALLGGGAHAVEVRVHGTLVENPPCTINNSNPINIEFGDAVRVKKIDGVNYLQRHTINVLCTQNPGAAMQLRLNGTLSSFDNTALATTVSDLAVRFKLNNQPFQVNNVMKINYPDALELSAVPVQNPGATLPAGEFEATAALLIEYQ